MKVITICGSMKYKDEMLNIAEKLSLKGICVLTPNFLTKPKEKYTFENFNTLSKLHMKKIELSDEILVMNIDNYIGNSTEKEIEYAKKLNKKITYYLDLT